VDFEAIGMGVDTSWEPFPVMRMFPTRCGREMHISSHQECNCRRGINLLTYPKTRMRQVPSALICGWLLIGFSAGSYADVGVTEPEWAAPPMVYELPHQLSVPRVEMVRDTVKIGNFTDDGATIEIVLIGNGERLYGGTGEASKIRGDLYLLAAAQVDHCTLLIHFDRSRIGIEGLHSDKDSSRFCPSKTLWLPAKVFLDTVPP